MFVKEKKFSIKKLFGIRESALVALIIVFAVAIVCIKSNYLSYKNIMVILLSAASTGIIACGMTLLLASGAMDLSVGSAAGLASVITCQFIRSMNMPVWLAIIGGLLIVGVLGGSVNGLISVKFRVSPFVITLGTSFIYKGLTQLISQGIGLTGFPEAFNVLGQGRLAGIQYPILICIVLVIIFDVLLRKSRYFRKSYYVGGNEKAAEITGINVHRVKIVNFIITGVLAAFAGILIASRFGSASVTIGSGMEMDVITACVIGGASLSGGEGTVLGAFLGALLLSMIVSALNMLGVDAYWQNVITGAILVITVCLDAVLKRHRETNVKLEASNNRGGNQEA